MQSLYGLDPGIVAGKLVPDVQADTLTESRQMTLIAAFARTALAAAACGWLASHRPARLSEPFLRKWRRVGFKRG